jgi:hypothetical protein
MSEYVPMSSLPLFAQSAGARATDPESSHEAAEQARQKLRSSQDAVLRVFKLYGAMSDEMLVRVYESLMKKEPSIFPQQTPSGLRTRRHELVLLEKIVYSGKRDASLGDRRIKPRIWRLARERP